MACRFCYMNLACMPFHNAQTMNLQAFQVLSEYLQLLDTLSELLAAQEMSRGVEVTFYT